MFVDLSLKNYNRLRQLKRENAENVMIFANALNKIRYDAIHEAINIKVGDNVYLRLHQDYIISKLINHKLSHQRIDPFEVFEKIRKLAFRLRLSSIMKIYSIISVTQLKLKSSKTNSYNWLMNFKSSSVVETNFEAFFYILKQILDKRIFRDQVYYLIKWKDYDNEHNVWYSVKALNDAQKLIAKYEAKIEKKV